MKNPHFQSQISAKLSRIRIQYSWLPFEFNAKKWFFQTLICGYYLWAVSQWFVVEVEEKNQSFDHIQD